MRVSQATATSRKLLLKMRKDSQRGSRTSESSPSRRKQSPSHRKHSFHHRFPGHVHLALRILHPKLTLRPSLTPLALELDRSIHDKWRRSAVLVRFDPSGRRRGSSGKGVDGGGGRSNRGEGGEGVVGGQETEAEGVEEEEGGEGAVDD